MRYSLFFPIRDERGSDMLDYFGAESVKEAANHRTYSVVYEGDAPTDEPGFIFQRHNVGDNGDGNRPLAQKIRSMCVGDFVMFENGAVWICDRFGWVEAPEWFDTCLVAKSPEPTPVIEIVIEASTADDATASITLKPEGR